MSEYSRSTVSKARKVLVVANPGSDSEGSEEHLGQYNVYPNPASQSHYHLPAAGANYSRYPGKAAAIAPTPLTTNLPPDTSLHYPSSRSNPTLSSPSSTSSRAVESTPPPTTPSVPNPPGDFAGEGLPSQEPAIASSSNDRIDGAQFSSRAGNVFNPVKVPSHLRSNQLQARPLPISASRPIPVRVIHC
jgi:hypothetical protein